MVSHIACIIRKMCTDRFQRAAHSRSSPLGSQQEKLTAHLGSQPDPGKTFSESTSKFHRVSTSWVSVVLSMALKAANPASQRVRLVTLCMLQGKLLKMTKSSAYISLVLTHTFASSLSMLIPNQHIMVWIRECRSECQRRPYWNHTWPMQQLYLHDQRTVHTCLFRCFAQVCGEQWRHCTERSAYKIPGTIFHQDVVDAVSRRAFYQSVVSC